MHGTLHVGQSCKTYMTYKYVRLVQFSALGWSPESTPYVQYLLLFNIVSWYKCKIIDPTAVRTYEVIPDLQLTGL